MSSLAHAGGDRLPADFFARPIAHRGLHEARRGVVENSLSAVSAAVEAGYAIEIDVQLSADGEAMVFHDDRLDRLTSARGLVREREAAALRALDLTGAKEGVPTLAEVLEVIAGAVPLVVEIKDQTGRMGPEVGALEARVAALLSAYKGPVAAMSFNRHSVEWFAAAAPRLLRGFVAQGPTLAPVAAPVDFLSHQWRDLPTAETSAFRQAGGALISWTICSPDDAEKAQAVSDQVTFEGFNPKVTLQ